MRQDPRRELLLLFVALLVSGCARGRDDGRVRSAPETEPEIAPKAERDPPPPPDGEEIPTMTNPDFDWTLSRSGDILTIEYAGKNASAERIHIVDKLVVEDGQSTFATTDRVVVVNFDEPGRPRDVVEVVLGEAPTNLDTYAPMHTPTYRPVEAGEPFSGSVSVPFPLKAWHPLGGTEPIRDDATRVLFRLQYFRGEPKRWVEIPAKDGTVTIPDGIRPEFFESAPKPRPR